MSEINDTKKHFSIRKSNEEDEYLKNQDFTVDINNSDMINIVMELTGINLFIYNTETDTFQIHHDTTFYGKKLRFAKYLKNGNYIVKSFIKQFATHMYIPHLHLTEFIHFYDSIIANDYDSPICILPLIAEDDSIVWIKIHCIPQIKNGKVVKIIGSYTDVTDIKYNELENQQSFIIFKMLQEQSLISIRVDLTNDKIVSVPSKNNFCNSDELQLITFTESRNLIASKYVKPEMRDDFLAFTDRTHLMELYRDNKMIDSYDYLHNVDGVYEWYRIMIYIYSINKEDVHCFLFVSNINQQKENEVRLDNMAKTDALTGLFNRFHGLMLIKEYLRENPNTSSSLIFLDIDNFKNVNDLFGHPYGDTILKSTADKIINNFGKDDIICRIGGDEFIVLQKNVTEEECCKTLNKLVSNIATTITIGRRTVFVSISAGYVMFPTNGTTFDELYKKADIAMFTAKSNGKNGFEQYKRIIKSINE